MYRRLLKPTLDELRTIEDHLTQLDQQIAELLAHHHDAVRRLAKCPAWASIPRSRSSRTSVPVRRVSISETARILEGRVPGQ